MDINRGCKPLARIFLSSLFLSTRSNAPTTSEQYNAIFLYAVMANKLTHSLTHKPCASRGALAELLHYMHSKLITTQTFANAYPLNGRECIRIAGITIIAIVKWTLIRTQWHSMHIQNN